MEKKYLEDYYAPEKPIEEMTNEERLVALLDEQYENEANIIIENNHETN